MSDAMNIAASGLKTEQLNLNRIAHDLANLNTNNYKASRFHFTDVIYQDIPITQGSAQIGLGTALDNSTKDFSPGPLQVTNLWNDAAIDGHGFFQVILSDGSTAYSRASSLIVDNDNFLSVQGGLRLADDIQIPEDFIQIQINKNGEIKALLNDASKPELIGQIHLAKFISPEQMTSLGNGLYKASMQSGEPLIDRPGQNGLGELLQGKTEASNVDMVASIMQLTMAQRIYQLNAKAFQIADELEKQTNEIRN